MRRGRPSLGLRAGAIGVALLTALPVFAPSAQATQSTASTTRSCLPRPHAITPEQQASVLALAQRKLPRSATRPFDRYPFGALRAEARYTRMAANRWASGFFTASLWRMYERTRDPLWLRRARAFTEGLLPVANYRGSHDLNFMVGLPAGLGAKLDPDPSRQQRYRNATITAARTLARRWNPRVQALKSADYEGQWAVIVDSAMNAPLLIEIGQLLPGPEGEQLAYLGAQHMRTLARTFVRPDGSTYHRVAFDPRTGAVVGPIPGQGLDPRTSTWSRGQAWAMNGFARAFALTGDPVIGEAATRTAAFWLDNVPHGCVPAWDFDVSNPRSPLDSSAAAIAADGLLVLDSADPTADTGDYARVLLGTLTEPWWLSTYSVNPGLLMQQTLNANSDPREGSYVWGDYYLLSALAPG